MLLAADIKMFWIALASSKYFYSINDYFDSVPLSQISNFFFEFWNQEVDTKLHVSWNETI